MKACHNKKYKWMIFVGCMCSAIQQLSGINVFVTASNQIFAQTGLSPSLVTTMSIIMTALNVIMTFTAIFPPDVNSAASSALVASNWITGIVMVFVGTVITDNTILFTLFLVLN